MSEKKYYKKKTDLINKTRRYGSKYKGYKDLKFRSETDQVIRQKLQDMLQESKDSLFKVVQQYFKSNNKDKAEFVDGICNQLDLFRNEVKNSEYGFTVQDKKKERNRDFDNVMEADGAMIYYADNIIDIISKLELSVLSGQDIQKEFLNIIKDLKILGEVFRDRKDYITGVSSILKIEGE
jgi:hypothetical protein